MKRRKAMCSVYSANEASPWKWRTSVEVVLDFVVPHVDQSKESAHEVAGCWKG